jgi:hypothetical protein
LEVAAAERTNPYISFFIFIEVTLLQRYRMLESFGIPSESVIRILPSRTWKNSSLSSAKAIVRPRGRANSPCWYDAGLMNFAY